MKKFIVSFITCLILMFPTSLFADPETFALQKGDKAPVEGVLLNAEAVAEILADRAQAEERCLIEIDQKVKLEIAKKNLAIENLQSVLDSERKQWNAEVENLNFRIDSLEELASEGNYDWFWWGLGGVAVGAVVAGSATAVVIALQ